MTYSLGVGGGEEGRWGSQWALPQRSCSVHTHTFAHLHPQELTQTCTHTQVHMTHVHVIFTSSVCTALILDLGVLEARPCLKICLGPSDKSKTGTTAPTSTGTLKSGSFHHGPLPRGHPPSPSSHLPPLRASLPYSLHPCPSETSVPP